MGDSYRPRRPDRDRGPPPLADRMTFTSGGGLNYDTYRPGDSQRQQGSNRPSKHSEFTFTSGQPGPQFPPEAPSGPRQSSRRRNRGGAPGQRDSRRGGNLEPSQPHRRQNGARRGGFRKPAPHERALLQNRDGGSPERTLGVAEGPNRFLNLEDLSDDEEADMDVESDKSSGENEPSSGQEVNPKVAKVQAADRPDGSSVPKWSNPDPYTVLPPPEETTGKKRDFVKLIRKAKNQAAEKAASNGAVAANDDFISFGDDADDAVVANAKPRVRIFEDGEELGFLTNHPVEGSLNQITDLRELGNGSLNETRPAAAAGLPQRPHHPGKRPADDADLPGRPLRLERAHKRKRNEFEGGIVEAWLPYAQSKSCPWVGRASYEHLKHDPVKWLHNEIMDFHDYVRPHQQEQDIRYNLVKRIQNALGGSMFPQSRGRVYPFGSFPTGLYLPTADMDLVYTSEQFYNGGPPAVDLGVFKTANSTLRKAVRRLETMHIAADAVVIARARVPIIKFVDRYTGINVDLSFENLSGVQAQATFEKWKIAYPDLQYLVALLKQFLIMRGLNDVHTGGLGGFTIICLAVNYIQNSPKTENLGELFLGFLDYYGNQFNLAKSRIQMNPPQVVDKTSVGIDGRLEKDDGLSIQDPNRPDNNISGGSHKAKDIFKTFSKGHKTLKDRIEALSTDQMPQASLLECILGGNYDSYERHRRHIRGL